MPSRWYRSLYWRIAIGFMLCLTAILVVQAMLFVWVVSRSGPLTPGQPPARYAQAVALDVGAALERDPALDVAQYIDTQYGFASYPFLVMLADGRQIPHGGPFPESLAAQARLRLRFPGPDRRMQRGGRFPAELGGAIDRRLTRALPIVADGQLAGVVVVPARAPFGFLLRRYAPTLALVAVGALASGALIAAVAIFGPARRRLQALEDAARRLGAGDLTARAPVRGGDEVAAVAAAFNTMADDLAARAEALAAADRARRQLLADVSHELNTPVTAMRGYLETLTMPELQLDEATRARYLEIVGDETGRLERIIGDLLDLARLEGGGGSLIFEAVPVAQLFARATARHERACGEAGVTIVQEIGAGADAVSGDHGRLEQALQNLVANAIRYAPGGSTVELRARRDADGTIAISVADRGRGIPPEHLPHVFDRFYKAEGARAPAGAAAGASGSGLGLSIVKAIVERHGGRVSATSEQGKTVFEMSGLRAASAPGAR
jgi:signal transduction histidine kinase